MNCCQGVDMVRDEWRLVGGVLTWLVQVCQDVDKYRDELEISCQGVDMIRDG